MIRALALAGMLALPSAASAAFSDVPAGYESSRAIEYLEEEGVLQGYADGRFRPAFSINRAEFLKVLVAGKGIAPDATLFSSCFPDVAVQWYAPYVCYAAAQGWVQGYPDGTFGPEKPVSFAEALKMLVNVRGYPPAPAEEIAKRGLDPTTWFSPYLTTAILLDVASYEQVWGPAATPLQAPLTRGFVAQLLYRSILAEGAMAVPLDVSACSVFPTVLEIKTFVDVVQPSKRNVFRQQLRGLGPAGTSCVLATDANPFGRVTAAFDDAFLQPYPAGQPKGAWTATGSLASGRAILRGGALDGSFRPELFVLDSLAGVLRQLPPVFAAPNATMVTDDGRYLVYVGATGRSLEAVDLVQGAHAFLDVVDDPLTLFGSADGGHDVRLVPGVPAVQYAVYDSSGGPQSGYALSATRFADLDAVFGSDSPFPPSPFDDPFPGASGTGAFPTMP